jgi:aspartyl-tRNA(Asn)/glutamyl-tRNA(Gln) amidotransferase subunit A
MTISETGERLRKGGLSCVALIEDTLRRIEERNEVLNAFITIAEDEAIERARMLDGELAHGRDRGPLHGVPIAIKDNLLTKGMRTTVGSKLFADQVPARSAAAVERLEAAGAVIIGKTNLHELAYGITSTNPHFGAVRNPWDTDRIPGGSSGGSGAAVADGLVPAALGSDTGGSIRIPASFCGCVGLKPTYGLVDRSGCQPLGLTLDHVGPLAATVHDAALIMGALVDLQAAEYTEPDALRFGIPDSYFFENSEGEIAEAVHRALDAAGMEAIPVRLPDIEHINAVSRVILLSEATAVHERYLKRRDDIGRDVLTLFDQGLLVSASDYVNAQRARKVFVRDFLRVFRSIDCLVTPTTPTTAPPIGQNKIIINGNETDVRLATTQMLRSINLLGFPAISIPCGKAADGLPIGMQLVGRPREDALLLRAAEGVEAALSSAKLWGHPVDRRGTISRPITGVLTPPL